MEVGQCSATPQHHRKAHVLDVRDCDLGGFCSCSVELKMGNKKRDLCACYCQKGNRWFCRQSCRTDFEIRGLYRSYVIPIKLQRE